MEPKRRYLKTRMKKELQALCLALVIPFTGTKNKLIDRILSIWELRSTLKNFDTPQEIIAAFKAVELKEMCRKARLWLGGNKYSKSASLLNWRNNCRSKGQRRFDEAREQVRKMREEISY